MANSVNHVRRLSSIKDQGKDRGTCSAFAVTAANEYAFFLRSGRYPDLSEQHLFHEAKTREGDYECGIWIFSAMEVILNNGQCSESDWGYNPLLPCIQQYGKPTDADSLGIAYINSYFTIPRRDVQAIKRTLASGKLVPFSIPIFDSWYRSGDVERTGRITMPLQNEKETGGHSMVLVGYQDNAGYEGGGYFIIRNSWGRIWGRDNFYGAGYGTIPYDYITQYNWEAFAF